MPPRPRLILFSGMGVDARLLAKQRLLAADVIVPLWIAPRDGESLADYARRLAALLTAGTCRVGTAHHERQSGGQCPPYGDRSQLEPSQPLFIGGVSFGGMIAQEVARHLPTAGLVLLATCRSWRGVPLPFRVAAWIGSHSPLWPIRIGRHIAGRLQPLMGISSGHHLAWLDAMLADTDPAFLRWAAGALLHWPGAGELPCPVVQIQGGHDLILPPRFTTPTHIIRGAGHLANITHAREVNTIINAFLMQARSGAKR